MVKTCVGTEFCRFGVQDSTNAGIELERRLENLFTPHKFKMGVVGCPRNCAEATVKDLGFVGQDGSWQVVVGGAAGKSVRKADLLITVETTEQALEAGELFFQYYRENAQLSGTQLRLRRAPGHRKDPQGNGLRAGAKKSESCSIGCIVRRRLSKDAWLERERPCNPRSSCRLKRWRQPGSANSYDQRTSMDTDHAASKIFRRAKAGR